MARNTGILDISKDDIWLTRIATKLKASNVSKLSKYLANAYGEKEGVIDLVLWRFCADNAWHQYGYSTFDDFIKNL